MVDMGRMPLQRTGARRSSYMAGIRDLVGVGIMRAWRRRFA